MFKNIVGTYHECLAKSYKLLVSLMSKFAFLQGKLSVQELENDHLLYRMSNRFLNPADGYNVGKLRRSDIPYITNTNPR